MHTLMRCIKMRTLVRTILLCNRALSFHGRVLGVRLLSAQLVETLRTCSQPSKSMHIVFYAK